MAVQCSPMTVGKLACCAMWLQEIEKADAQTLLWWWAILRESRNMEN